ncbi:hypothetical protein [Paenibacillus sp. YYML68]|uniref:hypothetical protein n=1 Tax=Paenibacillus sp. YYML68 TaxID=2909250 RepID=UPI00248F5AD3|nr:hypothetical protein [Paenibacillus sp. YYML68]
MKVLFYFVVTMVLFMLLATLAGPLLVAAAIAAIVTLLYLIYEELCVLTERFKREPRALLQEREELRRQAREAEEQFDSNDLPQSKDIAELADKPTRD